MASFNAFIDELFFLEIYIQEVLKGAIFRLECHTWERRPFCALFIQRQQRFCYAFCILCKGYKCRRPFAVVSKAALESTEEEARELLSYKCCRGHLGLDDIA